MTGLKRGSVKLLPHPDQSMQYDACKIKLALQFPDHRRGYMEGKQEFIECLLKEAYVWRQQQDR